MERAMPKNRQFEFDFMRFCDMENLNWLRSSAVSAKDYATYERFRRKMDEISTRR